MSDTLASVLAREVDLTRLPDEVPAALHKFISRCLEMVAVIRSRRQHQVIQPRQSITIPLGNCPTTLNFLGVMFEFRQ